MLETAFWNHITMIQSFVRVKQNLEQNRSVWEQLFKKNPIQKGGKGVTFIILFTLYLHVTSMFKCLEKIPKDPQRKNYFQQKIKEHTKRKYVNILNFKRLYATYLKRSAINKTAYEVQRWVKKKKTRKAKLEKSFLLV